MAGRTTTGNRMGAGYERWAWIELLGFDMTRDDLGVGALLGSMGFVPDGVSLLLFNADFVHTHGTSGPGAVEGSCFQVRIPGRGTVIVDVE